LWVEWLRRRIEHVLEDVILEHLGDQAVQHASAGGGLLKDCGAGRPLDVARHRAGHGLPMDYFAWLAGILLAYAALTHAANTIYRLRFGMWL
jgi:Mg2+-importing ATPase